MILCCSGSHTRVQLLHYAERSGRGGRDYLRALCGALVVPGRVDVREGGFRYAALLRILQESGNHQGGHPETLIPALSPRSRGNAGCF